jgi:SAM-dependent methyltransferase
MNMTKINTEYTSQDHEFREQDVYALAKYNWTIRKFRQTGIKESARIANIGSGSGTFTKILVKEGYDVFSTEPDDEARNQATKNCPGIQFHAYGLFDLPEEEMFDVIVMHDVLEHIDAEHQAIETVVKHLNPNGYFLVTVPASEFLFGHHDVQLGHFRRYTRTTMKRALGRNFRLVNLRYFGFLSIPIVWALSKRMKRDYPQLGSEKTSLVQRLYGLLCELEGRIPMPLGTAVLALAQLRE